MNAIENRLKQLEYIYDRNKKSYDFYTRLVIESKLTGLQYEQYGIFKKEVAKAERRMTSAIERYNASLIIRENLNLRLQKDGQKNAETQETKGRETNWQGRIWGCFSTASSM